MSHHIPLSCVSQSLMSTLSKTMYCTYVRRATRGWHLEHLPPKKNFKTLHCNLDICRNFQRI